MARDERTIKVVLVSVKGVKQYSRHEWRAVECEVGQRGHLNERGIRILYRNPPLYRATLTNPRSKGWQEQQHAKETARNSLVAQLGLLD